MATVTSPHFGCAQLQSMLLHRHLLPLKYPAWPLSLLATLPSLTNVQRVWCRTTPPPPSACPRPSSQPLPACPVSSTRTFCRSSKTVLVLLLILAMPRCRGTSKVLWTEWMLLQRPTQDWRQPSTYRRLSFRAALQKSKARLLQSHSDFRDSVTKWEGKWLNLVIAHIPRAALANPVVTRAMADANGMNIDLTLTPASPSQAAAGSAFTASGLAATPLPRPSASCSTSSGFSFFFFFFCPSLYCQNWQIFQGRLA